MAVHESERMMKEPSTNAETPMESPEKPGTIQFKCVSFICNCNIVHVL